MLAFIKIFVACLFQLSVVSGADSISDTAVTSTESLSEPNTLSTSIVLQDLASSTILQETLTTYLTSAVELDAMEAENEQTVPNPHGSAPITSTSRSWSVIIRPPRSKPPPQLERIAPTTQLDTADQTIVDSSDPDPTDTEEFTRTFKFHWGPNNLPTLEILTKFRLTWLWDPDEAETPEGGPGAFPTGSSEGRFHVDNSEIMVGAGVTLAIPKETPEIQPADTRNRMPAQPTAIPQADVVNIEVGAAETVAPVPHQRRPITRTMTRVFQVTRVVTRSIPPRPREPVQSVIVFTSTVPSVTRVVTSVVPARVTSRTVIVGASRTRVIPTVVPAHIITGVSVSGGVTHTSLVTREVSTSTFIVTSEGREVTSLSVVPATVSTVVSILGGVTRTFATTVPPSTNFMTTVDGGSTVIETYTESAKTVSLTTVEGGSTVVIFSTVEVEQTGFDGGGVTVVTEVRDMTRTYETVIPGETESRSSTSSLGEAKSEAHILDSSASCFNFLYRLLAGGLIFVLNIA